MTNVVRGQQAEMLTVTLGKIGDFVGYDKFGYTYFVINNTLHKDNELESLQYQNLALGRISAVDLNNPLKLVLLYPEFNTVVMLDNQLNEISSIDFSSLNEQIVVTAIGNASQNRLWFYDSLSQQIGLFNYETAGYTFLTQPIFGSLLHWEADFNAFQWIDGSNMRYSVDVYGKVTDFGKVPEFDHAKFVSEKELLYANDAAMFWFSSSGSSKKLLETDPNSFQSFWYKDQILSIFTPQAITTYKIITP